MEQISKRSPGLFLPAFHHSTPYAELSTIVCCQLLCSRTTRYNAVPAVESPEQSVVG